MRKRRLFVSLLLCSVLTLGLFSGLGIAAADEAPAALGSYQGQGNWYYYSGSYGGNALTRMIYFQRASFWQGEEPLNRITGDLTQSAQNGKDAVKAYIVDSDAQLTVSGKIVNKAEDDTAAADVKIVYRAAADIADNTNDSVLYSGSLGFGDEDISLDGVTELSGIDAKAGDVLFFIVSQATAAEAVSKAAFEVVVTLKNPAMREDAAYSPIPAASMSFKAGALALSDKAGRVVDDGGLMFHYITPNGSSEHFKAVSVSNGAIAPMTYVEDDTQGFYYSSTIASVGVNWISQYMSNDPVGDYSGLMYTAPQKGTVSVIGASAGGTGTGYSVVKVSAGGVVQNPAVASGSFADNTVMFEDVTELQDIALNKGESLIYLSVTPAWTATRVMCVFDFSADSRLNVSAVSNYTKYAGTYQGKGNWYYLSGDYEANALTRMIHFQRAGFWQGGATGNRINLSDLEQIAAGGNDAIRAYIAGADAKLSVSGSIVNNTAEGDTGITVKIVRRAAAAMADNSSDSVLYSGGFEVGDPEVDLGGIDALQNIEIKTGDALFFIVSQANGDTGRGGAAIFKAILSHTDAVETTAAIGAIPASTIDFKSGDLKLALDGVRPVDSAGLLYHYVTPNNDSPHLRAAYLSGGAVGYLTYTEDATQGFLYSSSIASVCVNWITRYMGNYPVDDFSGLMYTAPESGTLSLSGAVYGATGTGYRAVKVSASNIVSGTAIASGELAGSIVWLNEIAALQNINLAKGESVMFLAVTPPWTEISLMPIFDFRAAAQAGVPADGPDEPEPPVEPVFPTEQGVDGRYFAWGKPDKYMMMEYGYGDTNVPRWNGIEWNVSIEEGRYNPGAYTGVMTIYVADRSGEYDISGTATMMRTDGDGVVRMAVYKNGEVLWERSFTAAERNTTEDLPDTLLGISVAKGDLIMLYAEYVMADRVAYDTRCNFNVEVVCVTDDGDADDKDLFEYLSPISFAEYYGVTVGGDKNVSEIDGKPDNGNGNGMVGSIIFVAAGVLILAGGAVFMFAVRRKRS